jgi:hypothetical protein
MSKCAFGSLRRSVREDPKPHDGHARSGEVGLRPRTCEPSEQGGQLTAEVAEEGLEENIVKDAHVPDSEAYA